MPRLALLVLLACGLAAVAEEEIRFPDDAGVIDLTKEPFNAVGDGVTDCSDAIQKALDQYAAKNRILYLPKGTYLVKHTLEWGPSKRLNPGKVFKGEWGEVWRLTILQGEARDQTVIRLADASEGFGAAEWNKKDGRPGGKPVIFTGGWPAQRFRNAVRNLTIDTGKGNPGAIGIQFNASNQGTLHRVLVRSGDGQGAIGVDIGYCGDHGPGAGRHIEVRGFDYGVWASSMNSMTLWDLTLSGQRKAGIKQAGEVLILGEVKSENAVPALVVSGSSFLSVIEGRFAGGSPSSTAVVVEGDAKGKHVFIRDVAVQGYGASVGVAKDPARGVATGELKEWSLHPGKALFPGDPVRTLRLPVKRAPELPFDPLGKAWANPLAFGATGDGKADDTEGIQKAIDSGASTIYFPGGKVFNFTAITIRAGTRRLIGCETYLNGDRITVAEGSGPLVFERFHPSWGKGRGAELSIECPRPVIVRDLVGFKTHQRSTGDLFVEDVCGTLFIDQPDGRAWCRFFNYEPNKTMGIENQGDLWLLGGKTEHEGPKMLLKKGSRTELFGAFWYASFGKKVAEPGIELEEGAALSITTHRQFSFNKGAWPIWIKATRGGESKVWSDWNLDWLSIGAAGPAGVK